jgi:DNA excision repair protein ERCC-6
LIDSEYVTEARTQRVKKKKRLAELKTKEKQFLEAKRKRILVEKRRKALSLEDENDERERLIRTGVITPFENLQGKEKRPKQKRKRTEDDDEDYSEQIEEEAVDEAELEDLEKYEDKDEFAQEESELDFDEEDQPKKKRKTPKVEAKTEEETFDDGDEKRYQSRLSAFLDSRQVEYTIDDDLMQLTKDTISNHEQVELTKGYSMPKNMHDQLFDYQKTGVRWLYELYKQGAGGIIGDEMGLGKTIQAVAFLAALDHVGEFKPSIIITPATVMRQWVREFHDWWPAFRVVILHSSGSASQDKKEALVASVANHKRGIIVTTYDAVRINQDLLTDHEWGHVILDEGHRIRNPDAEVTISCKKFETPHRLILSGTPIQNNLKELWSLFDFVFPGKLGTLPTFQHQFGIPISQGGYSNASPLQVQTAYKCAVMLRDMISPYLLRRLKRDVQHQLPKKKEQVLFCKLTEIQVQAYHEFLQRNDVKKVSTGKGQMFRAVTILRQLCNHPDLLLHGTDNEPEDYGAVERAGKLQVVEQVLPMWKEQGHRVLLFSQSRQMLDILEAFIIEKEYKYMRMDGTTNVKNRVTMIDKYNNDDSYFLFLLTTKVGGIGINLTGADRVILYDPDWNPSTDLQALERAWRLGQKRDVTVYRLMTSGTIEEKMYHRQIFKQFLSNKILKDPRQRRFFKSNELYELFKLGAEYNTVRKKFVEEKEEKKPKKKKVKKPVTETGAIFAAFQNEIPRMKKRQKGQEEIEKEKAEEERKKQEAEEKRLRKEAKKDQLYRVEDLKLQEEEEKDEKDETFILKALFDRTDGLKSMFNHDAIFGSDVVEKQIVEQEAHKIAKKAAHELKRSREKVPVGTPTWTGKHGAAPPPEPPKRFGNKAPAIIPVNRSNNISPPKAPTSSSALLRNMRDTTRTPNQRLDKEDLETVDVSSQDKAKQTMIREIREFMILRGGTAPTSAITAHFKDKYQGEETILFREMLKQIAQFNKSESLWYLKKSFK